MNYYDKLMLEYYRVLNNAWKSEIRDASRLAIKMFSDMPRAEKLNKNAIEMLMGVIKTTAALNALLEILTCLIYI